MQAAILGTAGLLTHTKAQAFLQVCERFVGGEREALCLEVLARGLVFCFMFLGWASVPGLLMLGILGRTALEPEQAAGRGAGCRRRPL